MIRYAILFCQTVLLLTLTVILPLDSYAFPDTCYKEYPYSMILALQNELTRQGFDPGPIDGMWGSKTRKAVNDYQRAKAYDMRQRSRECLMAKPYVSFLVKHSNLINMGLRWMSNCLKISMRHIANRRQITKAVNLV